MGLGLGFTSQQAHTVVQAESASVEVECTDTCMYICSEATESGVGS